MSRVWIVRVCAAALVLFLAGHFVRGEGAVAQQPALSGTQAPLDAAAAARQLVQASGAREALVANEDRMMQAGADSLSRDPDAHYSPEFIEEWRKRMRASFNPDDYVAVVVRVYATHFTAEELQELAQAASAKAQSQTPQLSDALRAKVAAQQVAVQSEIMGGCAEIGARLGGEIGQQIQKEHPEWVQAAAAKPSK